MLPMYYRELHVTTMEHLRFRQERGQLPELAKGNLGPEFESDAVSMPVSSALPGSAAATLGRSGGILTDAEKSSV